MLKVILEGRPFERGFFHGKIFSHEIKHCIEKSCLASWYSSEKVKQLEKNMLSTLSSFYPDSVIEMLGISEGAGVDFKEILLLNLMVGASVPRVDSPTSIFRGCTGIGFTESDVGPIVGKNCDGPLNTAEYYLLEIVHPHRGNSFACISWTGTLWAEAGLNDFGFAFVQTAGPTMTGQDGRGIVCCIAPRFLLSKCSTVEEGLNLLKQWTISGCGMGLILVDATGDIAVVEKSYTKQSVTRPEKGIGFCTNHFVTKSMQGMMPLPIEGITINSENRYQTLKRIFSKHESQLTIQMMEDVLRNHDESGAICRHGQGGSYSLYSSIMVTKRKEIWLTEGLPCQGDFIVHPL